MDFKKNIVLFLASTVLLGFGVANSIAEDLPIWKRPKGEQLKYYESKLKEAEIKIQKDSTIEPIAYLDDPLQKIGILRTFVGDAYGASQTFDRLYEIVGRKAIIREDDLDRLNNATLVDAISAIVEEAKQRRIVILNEAHHMPLHRAFAMKLAKELRKIGYDYLACETFGEDFNDGFLKQSTGFYSREPMFANFLRDAYKDGWKFVQYEPMNLDRKLSSEAWDIARESGQAKNIMQATLTKNPAAKIFVYVGYGHGMRKRSEPSDIKFMAEYLGEYSGVNILSVDQTVFYEHTKSTVNYPLYKEAIGKADLHQLNLQKAFVLKSSFSAYEVFDRYRNRVDIQVVHPSYKIDPHTHRMEWLSSVAGFVPHEIPEKLLPKLGRRIIYAFRANEFFDAVPVDAVLVEVGKPVPKLMLPPGEFRFEIEE